MNAPTQADRTALISQHLGVSAPFSPIASALNEIFVETIADCRQELDPVEEARVLSALMLQISGRLAALHGNR